MTSLNLILLILACGCVGFWRGIVVLVWVFSYLLKDYLMLESLWSHIFLLTPIIFLGLSYYFAGRYIDQWVFERESGVSIFSTCALGLGMVDIFNRNLHLQALDWSLQLHNVSGYLEKTSLMIKFLNSLLMNWSGMIVALTGIILVCLIPVAWICERNSLRIFGAIESIKMIFLIFILTLSGEMLKFQPDF